MSDIGPPATCREAAGPAGSGPSYGALTGVIHGHLWIGRNARRTAGDLITAELPTTSRNAGSAAAMCSNQTDYIRPSPTQIMALTCLNDFHRPP